MSAHVDHVTRHGPGTGFADLSVVSLIRAIEVDGRTMPRGAIGTVVGVYGNGGYEVEFMLPFHAVLTLGQTDLSA
jgi:hypothetical protein